MNYSRSTDSPTPIEDRDPVVENQGDEVDREMPDQPKKQKKQKGKFAKKIGGSVPIVLTLLLLAGGGGWYWWHLQQMASQEQAQPEAPPGVPVKVAPVELVTLQDTSEFVGTLEAEQSVVVRPQIAGRLSQINVRAGDRVRQGETIARIDPKEIEARLRQAQAAQARTEARLAELEAGTRPEDIAQSQARLDAAQAQLAELRAGTRQEEIAQERARLNAAEAQLAELRAGTRQEEIAQSQARLEQAQSELDALRSGSRQDEIAQARAQIEQAQAQVSLTQERVERNRMLVEEGAISRDRFDEVETDNISAQADLDRAQQRLEELQKKRREEIETAEAGVEEARQALAQKQNGFRPEEIARAEAAVEEARQALAQKQNGARPEEIARVEAEVEQQRQELRKLQNGTRPEEIDQAEAELAEAIAQVRAFEVELQDSAIFAPFTGIIGDVPVKLGDYVKAGDELTTLTQNDSLELRLAIPLEKAPELRMGLPVEITNAQGQPLSRGRITFISPTVNKESQTVLAKASFENRSGQLRDRAFVRAKVIWSQRENAIVVPTTAVVFQGDRRFIFVTQEGENLIANRKSVELGLVKGDRAEIVKGLVPGDTIIVSGLQKLRDGAPITVLPSQPPTPDREKPETNPKSGE